MTSQIGADGCKSTSRTILTTMFWVPMTLDVQRHQLAVPRGAGLFPDRYVMLNIIRHYSFS